MRASLSIKPKSSTIHEFIFNYTFLSSYFTIYNSLFSVHVLLFLDFNGDMHIIYYVSVNLYSTMSYPP